MSICVNKGKSKYVTSLVKGFSMWRAITVSVYDIAFGGAVRVLGLGREEEQPLQLSPCALFLCFWEQQFGGQKLYVFKLESLVVWCG